MGRNETILTINKINSMDEKIVSLDVPTTVPLKHYAKLCETPGANRGTKKSVR